VGLLPVVACGNLGHRPAGVLCRGAGRDLPREGEEA
jgi:hypothetical protein